MTAANISDIISLMASEYGNVAIWEHQISREQKQESLSETNLAPLKKAASGDLTFCDWDGDSAVRAIMDTHATFVVCHEALHNEPDFLDWSNQSSKMLIFVKNPRLWIMRVLKHFSMTFQPYDYTSIKPSSHVHDTVSFHGEVKIGERCVIDPYVVLGEDGFGYERNEYGKMEKFPHLGGVAIGDDTDIGVHTVIDRATLPNEFTTIGNRCKVDNFVHVAHNVNVGTDTVIVSHCNLGGSVVIGRQCWIAMSVCIKDGVKIGNRCILGNCANIRKDVPDNMVVVGDDTILGYVDEKPEWVKLVGSL